MSCTLHLAAVTALACLTLGDSGCTHTTPGAATAVGTHVGAAQSDFDTAGAFAARGDFVRAEQYYVSALRRGQPDRQVIVKLLRVCVGSSRFRAALGYAELYLMRHPGAWSLRYLAATLHIALEQPVAARRELARVLQSRPAHEASLRMLARLRERPTAEGGQ